MTDPSSPPSSPQAPEPNQTKGRMVSLALAVAIAAVGGFILARLGGGTAGAPDSPGPGLNPRALPPALTAQLRNVEARGLPTPAVLEAVRVAQGKRGQVPPQLQRETLGGTMPPQGAAPSWEERVAQGLRGRVDGCAKAPHAPGRLAVEGSIKGNPLHGFVLDQVRVAPAEKADPWASIGACVASALEGAPLPEPELPGTQKLSMHFDL